MLREAIVEGKINEIEEIIRDLLKSENPNSILKEMIKAMEIVGDLFEKKEYYVPEVLLSAHTMQKGLNILKPHLVVEEVNVPGKVLIGSVEGDVHDIGKNLVAMFLEGSGFEVHDLGRDVPISKFIEKTKEIEPDILALSALMTTTMEKMRETIERLRKEGLREKVKVIVGGASVTEEFAKEIGADGYAEDAVKAVSLCEKLMKG
ncbi:MAG: corrinoid protein [Candidatus Hydrothermarchaeota archaeon]